MIAKKMIPTLRAKRIMLWLFLASSGLLLAQREASNWYFGVKAGLDFNSGAPVALTDGEIVTKEGCSSISDRNGNLLFYTDGVSVWDKRHRVMPNGTGLLGHESSTQSGIIVPKPGSNIHYYIFTVDEPDHEETVNFGLNYTLVDMTLNNGFGDVVSSEKNVPLITYNPSDPDEVKYKCSEKISAVQHADGNSFWVVTHFIDSFYSFHVDYAGVNTNPVKTTTNVKVPLGGYKQNAIGYLKISPDGTKLAVAHSQTSLSDLSGPKTAGKQTGKIVLYNFDAASGAVSNENTLLSQKIPYGVEFSPKTKKLYCTINIYDNTGTATGSKLFQYDLTAANISGSQVEINASGNVAGALQLAIDGKIYRAGYPISGTGNSISVINAPEETGTQCNYSQNTVSLNGQISELGLPPFVQSFFLFTFDYQNLCLGGATDFKILSEEPYDGVEWDFGDGSPVSTDDEPSHVYATPGTYTASLTKIVGGVRQNPVTKNVTIFDAPLVPSSPVELTQCVDDTSTSLARFNLHQADSSVSLDTDQIINVFYYPDIATAQADVDNTSALPYIYNAAPGTSLVAKVYNPISGCYNFADVTLQVKTNIVLSRRVLRGCDLGNGQGDFDLDIQKSSIISSLGLPGDTSIRFYKNKVEAELGSDNYLPSNIVASNSTLFIRIDNENVCYGSGEIDLRVEPKFQIVEHETYPLCTDSPSSTVMIDSGIPGTSVSDFTYFWSTGETTPEIVVSAVGTYTLEISNSIGCSQFRTVEVVESGRAFIEDVIVNDIQQQNEVRIEVSGPGDYLYAFESGPPQESNVFKNVPIGIHNFRIIDKNGCGEIVEEVSVVGFPKFFTPNGDQANERWQLQGISAKFQPSTPVYIYDRYGKLVKELDPVSSGWDGIYQGLPLPSTDYWFTVTLQDGRLIKGHFALIR